MCRTDLQSIKNGTGTVVIYGALQSDEIIIKVCSKLGINVSGICDDSLRKAGNNWCGLPVYTFEEITAKFIDLIFIINVSYLKRVVEKIEAKSLRWMSCTEIVQTVEYSNLDGIEELNYEKSEIERASYCHKNYLTPGKIYMKNIDVVVTERCSLRCKECSNLMQFYYAPVDYVTEEIVKNVDALLSVVDGIYELRFIGGEPFMNRNLHKVMQPFIDDQRTEKLLIYTNATILPTEEQWEILSNPKVIFMITNYGDDKSRNYKRLIQVLRQRDITYHVLRMDYWNPCDTFERHNRTQDELETIFEQCCVKDYVTLLNNRLFRCPYSAHAMNLRAVPYEDDDFYTIPDKGIEVNKERKALFKYLFEKKSLRTCDFCRSRSFASELIPVAEQCDKPRVFKMYR